MNGCKQKQLSKFDFRLISYANNFTMNNLFLSFISSKAFNNNANLIVERLHSPYVVNEVDSCILLIEFNRI